MSTHISHQTVIDHVAGSIGHLASARVFRSSALAWCRFHAVDPTDPADITLGVAYEARYQQFCSDLHERNPGNPLASKNVRSASKKLHAGYRALTATIDLPVDFNSAFKLALDARNMKPLDLIQLLRARFYPGRSDWSRAQLYHFYEGTQRPGSNWRGDSRALLRQVEEVLDLPPGTLLTRGYPSESPILVNPHAEISYRSAAADRMQRPYALKQLPTRVQSIWKQFAQWRFSQTVFVRTQLYLVTGLSLWTKESTEQLHRQRLQRFFGWLCLPRPPAGEETRGAATQELVMFGKGRDPADLSMKDLFDLNTLTEFLDFCRNRQFNKSFTGADTHFLYLVNSFVSTPHAFLTAHPQLASEFGFDPPIDDNEWATRMDAVHQRLLRVIRSMRRAVTSKQRSPEEPLRHVLNTADPYSLFLEMLDRMEHAKPLPAQELSWSLWTRNTCFFRMQIEVPLRARNVCDLQVGRHLRRNDNTGLWHLNVPKLELKNHYSKAAEDVQRVYSAETSRIMDRYWTSEGGRAFLLDRFSSPYFFLSSILRRGGEKDVARKGQLETSSLAVITGTELKRYFGQSQGSNIFRHLNATSILKDDPTQVPAAAAVLNSSEDTVRHNYKHLLQEDMLRHADAWRASKTAARGLKKPRGDGDPKSER